MSTLPLSTDQSLEAEDAQLAKHYQLNGRFKQIGDRNVWSFILGLAQKYSKVNLGQVSSVLEFTGHLCTPG